MRPILGSVSFVEFMNFMRIHPASPGVIHIEVIFSIGTYEIMHVSAKDKAMRCGQQNPFQSSRLVK